MGEVINVSRCEVVILDGQYLASLGCFEAVMEELMFSHVCNVKEGHGGDERQEL